LEKKGGKKREQGNEVQERRKKKGTSQQQRKLGGNREKTQKASVGSKTRGPPLWTKKKVFGHPKRELRKKKERKSKPVETDQKRTWMERQQNKKRGNCDSVVVEK